MSRHLKSIIISRLDSVISHYVPSPAHSVAHARGVRYFVAVEGIQALWGSMNTVQESRHYRKHIIVRCAPEHNGLFQLYTYHFPKTWSAACVANRELIKLAQRQAHALEHDYSMAALEYRLRFFKHYFRVFRCGEQPEPGMKRYSRFYQYTYVAIYRELKAAQQKAQQKATEISEDLSFEPIVFPAFPSRENRICSLKTLWSGWGTRNTRNVLPPTGGRGLRREGRLRRIYTLSA